MITVQPATTAADLDAVRALCWDYRAYLMDLSDVDAEIMRTFYPEPVYARIMHTLPQMHARPHGIILLAKDGDTQLGCTMTHRIDAQTAEIKRLFVAPDGRGMGVARKLMHALMSQARADGFQRVVLDTSVNLQAARRLYTSLGMTECAAYQDLPAHVLPHLIFFEAHL
ncbi:MAG: GNAT family N-acetyltransferase [Sulfitobacter sp.]